LICTSLLKKTTLGRSQHDAPRPSHEMEESSADL
jgi:hypothetical protein